MNYSLGCLYIDKSTLNPLEKQVLKDNLSVTEYNYITKSHDTVYYFFESKIKDKEFIIVPRFYNSVFDIPKIKAKEYFTKSKEKINIEMIKFPNPRDPEQQKAVDFMTREDNTHGIIKAYTGFGKTWCTIRAICNLKVKSIIIVDKEKLRNQWVESFLKFTNLTKEDIGIIQGRDSFMKAIQKPIVIATVQTLASVIEDKYFVSNNKYLKAFYDAGFEFTVLDEVHKTSTTPFFSKASLFFMTKRIYGLSATPKKSNDKATLILRSYFGNNVFIPDTSNKIKPSVVMIIFNSRIPHRTIRWITFGGSFNYVRYRKKLLEQDVYKKLVTTTINALNSKDDTTGILFVAHEIKFLETLSMNYDNCGIIHSGTSDEEKKKKLIFATYGSVTAGLSIDHLNRLILGTPISGHGNNLEQVSGRITRDHTNKESNPKIIDFVDITHPSIINLAVSRFNEYRRLGINVEVITAYDDGKFYLEHEYIDLFNKYKEKK